MGTVEAMSDVRSALGAGSLTASFFLRCSKVLSVTSSRPGEGAGATVDARNDADAPTGNSGEMSPE